MCRCANMRIRANVIIKPTMQKLSTLMQIIDLEELLRGRVNIFSLLKILIYLQIGTSTYPHI